ncbi:MAG TPA: hypothetical protein VFX30_02500 [bacterium]|nr:hypothetical protein [bacterium]
MRLNPVSVTLPLLVVCAVLWAGGIPGCTYSKSYFRLDANGKMIKADGPITPEELSGEALPTENEGEETGGSEVIAGTTGSDENAGSRDTTGGDGSDTEGGTTTGNTAGTVTGGYSIPTKPAF